MGMRDAFAKHWVVWVLFFCANGMLPLVNTIEGSFARTLIACDEPASESPDALFSGSARCGDRLLVINEGQVLSSVAASQEGVAKILMMLVAAACTDIYGRKPVLLVGLGCTALSIVLFLAACASNRWAKSLFIMGQGLQGACPVELLFQQVAADLAAREGADTMGVFELQGIVKFLPVVIFGSLASVIQMLELRDYTWLWACVLAANSLLLGLTALHFPETRAGQPSEASRQGVVAGMRHELREYGQLFTSMRGVGRVELVLAYLFVDAIARARFSILTFSFCMSHYGMTAAQVILYALPIVLVHTVCTPVVGRVCRALGMQQGFVAVCAYKAGVTCFFALQPFLRWAWFTQYYLSSVASGWDALSSALSSALFKERTSKYVALTTLCSYGANAVAAPLYAYAFDAKADTYLGRLWPGLLSFALNGLAMGVLFAPATGVWALFRRGLGEMQREENARGAAVPEASAKKAE